MGWMPHRDVRRNRLGLLRRAIEEDWPEPEAGKGEASSTPARDFAARFYAARAGNTDTPVAPPSQRDCEVAGNFIGRLEGVGSAPAAVAEAAAQFGAYVRRQEAENSKAPISLVIAVRSHGDAFLVSWKGQRQKARQKAARSAREAHKERFEAAYQDYLRERERELSTSQSEPFARFLAEERKKRTWIARLPGEAKQEALASFDTEQAHIERMREFFARDTEGVVLDFWTWDKAHNPQGFGSERA